MRTFDMHQRSSSPRTQRNWVMETVVVLGIVAFGLFALVLEGHLSPFQQAQSSVALPYELTR